MPHENPCRAERIRYPRWRVFPLLSGPRVRTALATAASFLVPFACAEVPKGGAPPVQSIATKTVVAPASSVAAPLPADAVSTDASAPSPPWADVVRAQHWEEAWRVLEALPDDQRSQPETRLVRGRVALLRGDGKGALDLFQGLEQSLALATDDLARWRADASLAAGLYADAGRAFAAQTGAKAIARAAFAFDKAGMAEEAKKSADHAIALGAPEREEPALRSLRARIAEGAGQKQGAIDDARWIVLKAPQSDDASAAEATLARLDPDHPLTGRERMRRATKLADAVAHRRRAPGA